MSILVATGDGLRAAGDGQPELSGHRVRQVVATGGQLVAIVDERRIDQRTDHGWTTVAKPSGDEAITSILPVDGAVLVGIQGAHLELDGDRLDSFERAPTHDDWHTPWGGPPDVRSMSMANDGTIYVNVHVGGILRSSDRGTNWSPTIDLHADVHQVLCPIPDRPELVVAACAIGLAQSLDAGETWTIRTRGLRHAYSRAVAVAGDAVLVSTSNGPRGNDAAVYRSRLEDLEAPLEKCAGGLPEWFDDNVDTGWLAGTREGQVAFITGDGALYVSNDTGTTWTGSPETFNTPSWLIIT